MTLQNLGVYTLGQIAVGGKHGYIEIVNSDTSFDSMVAAANALVMGVTFRVPTGELYAVSTASQTAANVEHDIDWLPDDSGLLVARVPSNGILELRKYAFDGTTILDTWTGLNVEAGWAQQPVKITIACDSRTVLYTQSLHKVQAYDLVTRSNLADYETIPFDSLYIYGGIRLLPEGMTTADGKHFIVAMTRTGDGPQRAVCLDSDGLNHWVDEINPTSGYHIQKRTIADGTLVTQILTQYDTNSAHNDKTLSLACLYGICHVSRMPIIVTLIS